MAYQFPPDLDELVREQMASGNYDSEDDLLRDALLAFSGDGEAIVDEDVAALEEALRELDAGDPGVDLDEAFRRIRERHGIDSGA
jgi:Arc/MetJ-type ribon-helix-helix transcriptional regulator